MKPALEESGDDIYIVEMCEIPHFYHDYEA